MYDKSISITSDKKQRAKSRLLADSYLDAKFRMTKYIKEMHEFPRVGKMGVSMLAEITGLSQYAVRHWLKVLNLNWKNPRGYNK
jgi:DNA-binding transcriptional ArsR family regulator